MLPCLECPQQLQLYTAVGCRIATRCLFEYTHRRWVAGGWLASGQPRTGPIWQVCGRLLGARSKLSRLSSGDAAAAMAAEPARTARERLLTPPILDMRRTDEQLRELCKGILRDSLTPMVALAHHGCEDHCAALVTSALLIRNAASAPETAPQTAYEFDTHHPLQEQATKARDALQELAIRMMCIIAGPGVLESLGCRGQRLEGRLKMRSYPSGGNQQLPVQRLGPHCDATLITMLWSDAPGLQVVDPSTLGTEWTAQHLMNYGLPSMGPMPPELKPEQWATVHVPDWEQGVLLLTLGTGWHQCAVAMERLPAKSAVLHRVNCAAGWRGERHSLPFFLDAVTLPV